MKLAVCILILGIAAIVAAEGDAGHFIPRAFYTLDANGHQSELHFVHPNTAHYLRRLRRSSSYTSSSSSSSSVSATDDGPVLFSSTQQTHQGATDQAGRPTSHGQVLQTVGVVDKKGRLQTRVSHGHY